MEWVIPTFNHIEQANMIEINAIFLEEFYNFDYLRRDHLIAFLVYGQLPGHNSELVILYLNRSVKASLRPKDF